MRTKAGNFVVVPNSMLAKDTITNYCGADASHAAAGRSRRELRGAAERRQVGHSRRAARVPRSCPRPASPKCGWRTSAHPSIVYRVRFWVSDFEADERAQGSRAFAASTTRSSGTTSPSRTRFRWRCLPKKEASCQCAASSAPTSLASAALFSSLSPEERTALLAVARPVQYAAGEAIVRQGQAGRSLFVVVRGEASVTLAARAERLPGCAAATCSARCRCSPAKLARQR